MLFLACILSLLAVAWTHETLDTVQLWHMKQQVASQLMITCSPSRNRLVVSSELKNETQTWYDQSYDMLDYGYIQEILNEMDHMSTSKLESLKDLIPVLNERRRILVDYLNKQHQIWNQQREIIFDELYRWFTEYERNHAVNRFPPPLSSPVMIEFPSWTKVSVFEQSLDPDRIFWVVGICCLFVCIGWAMEPMPKKKHMPSLVSTRKAWKQKNQVSSLVDKVEASWILPEVLCITQ